MDIFEILDRESYSKSEVYLYEENGKWFAYERSATLLRNWHADTIWLKNQMHSFYGVMIEKIEVDLAQLLGLNWYVALCADSEMMLIKSN